MMVWRRLTVITFHVEPSSVPIANSSPVSGHHEVNPTPACTTALDPSVSARHVPLPSLRDNHGAEYPPAIAPSAKPKPMIVKVFGLTSSTSCANSTSNPALIALAMFIRPRMIAIDRSRWCPHSQRTPSLSSARHVGLGSSRA